MADTKITALTALTGADPANDVIPIVDVSDTTMAASGTTKKISVNNILGASGTATLASATITGDLTVDTNVLKVDTTLNRVGIGTASPAVTLDVVGAARFVAAAAGPKLSIENAGGSTRFKSTDTSSFYYSAYDHYFTNTDGSINRYTIDNNGVSTWYVSGSTAMTLNSTGLGVGGSVTTFGYNKGLTLVDPTSAALGIISGANGFYVGLTSSGGPAINVTNNQSLSIVTGGSTSMVVTSSGNVGIGVTPSAWGGSYKALQLQSVARNIAATGAGSGDLTVAFNAIYDSTDSRWEYAGTGDKAGRYSQTGSGNHRWFVSNTAGTAGNEITDFASPAMTLDSGGNLLVGVTSANASGGVLQLKSGITFPATQVASSDANTLDDYEEGNWTPSITFGGASVGMTGTFAGRYTKVGRAVTINGIIALTAKGSSTGIARIAGLPFTSANASGEYTAISIRIDRVSFADYPCGYVGPNSSVVELENTTNAGTVSSMTDSNFINTSVVIVNFTYTV